MSFDGMEAGLEAVTCLFQTRSSISFLDCRLLTFKILSCNALLAVDEILTFKTVLGIGGNRVYENSIILTEKYNNF